MKFSTKLAVGSVLALASVSAFAQVSVPTPPYSGTLNDPTTGNGSAMLTLFSQNDATPYSYEFNLGLNFNDLVPTNGMNTAGLSLTWSLTGLTVPGGVSTSDLMWHVTAAAATGATNVAGTYHLLTTVDQSVSAATVGTDLSGNIFTTVNNDSSFIQNVNGFAGNPKSTTDTTSAAYANAHYNAILNALPFNAAAGVSSALNFFELTTGRGNNSALQSVTQYAGTWSLNLAADTLTYSVPGGSTTPPPVPLPAALWLLLSGLTGMGVVGRRKNAAVAA